MKTNAQQKKTKESKKAQQRSYQNSQTYCLCTFCEQFLHIQLFHVPHFHQKKS